MESSSSSQHMSNMEGPSSQQNESIDNRENEIQDAEDDSDGDVIIHTKYTCFLFYLTLNADQYSPIDYVIRMMMTDQFFTLNYKILSLRLLLVCGLIWIR
jgi:hypothetical protein